MGYLDAPGIIVIKDMDDMSYYRNYEIYQGDTNFKKISTQLLRDITNSEKRPLYSNWQHAYMNINNWEYWSNNMIKAYIYATGLFSAIVIPIVLIIDIFFFPVVGYGPVQKKRREEAKLKREAEKAAKENGESSKNKKKQE